MEPPVSKIHLGESSGKLFSYHRESGNSLACSGSPSVVEQKGRYAQGRINWRGPVSKFTWLRQNQLDQVRWIDPTFGQQFRQDTIFLAQDGLRNCPFVN